MILYLVKGYLDLAATTLADAQALLTALANPALAANQATIDRITGKLETLVQSDSGEPLTISSIDDTSGTYSAWVTDAQTTLAVGLGLPNTSTLDTYASTTSFSITGNTRTGTLALNSRELSNGLLRGGLRLQIRTTNSAGAAETRGLLRIAVVPGVLESPVGDRDVDYTSYVEVAALATAAAASATAASTAETHAETAETNAETAETAAAISAAAALVSENAASASASTATTQAGIATTQAGTATTQAGIATTQAGLAATAKTAAETAETNAETAETNAETAEAAAAVSAAAALVSEAAALVSKNAAAASAATASAVSGSGNGTFSAAALTGVNSVTASASTALTLTGGTSGASLVLAAGTPAGFIANTNSGGQFAVRGGLGAGNFRSANTSGANYWEFGRENASTGDFIFANTGANVSRFTNTGNLLIGTTTDMTGSGGLTVASNAQKISRFSSTFATTGSYVEYYDAVNAATRGYVGWGTVLGMGAIGNYGITSAGNLYLGSNTGANNAVYTSTGNLLIGTTTDAANLAGGLVINGSGAGAAASNTTTGALRVTGGVGVSGAGYFGGSVNAVGSGSITSGATTSLFDLVNTNENFYSVFRIRNSGTSGKTYEMGLGGNSAAGSLANRLYFYDATAAARRLSIASTGEVNVDSTTSASSSTVGALTIGNGTAATNVAIGGGNVNAGGTLVVGSTYANSAKAFIFGTLKVGGDAGQATGTIVLGDDQSSGTNVGLYRGQSSMAVGAGNWLNLAGYDGVNITAGAATFGSQTKALSITSTTATFAGAVTIGGTVIHTLSATPASASATGTVGTMSWDANYIYICTATNTWKRVAIATW